MNQQLTVIMSTNLIMQFIITKSVPPVYHKHAYISLTVHFMDSE